MQKSGLALAVTAVATFVLRNSISSQMVGYVQVDVDDRSPRPSDDLEKENLLGADAVERRPSSTISHFLVPALAISNVFLLLTALILSLRAHRNGHPRDPSLLVYCTLCPLSRSMLALRCLGSLALYRRTCTSS